MKNQIGSAVAFLWPQHILIQTYNQTIAGFYIAGKHLFKLDASSKASDIGDSVVKALGLSESGLPVPDYKSEEWKNLIKNRLATMGVKSEKDFMEDAKSVVVQRNLQSINFTPSENSATVGDKKGFTHLPKSELVIPETSDPQKLGEALLQAWQRCR